MVQTIKYFSAEVASPTLMRPYQRIRIRNRANPSEYTDHRWRGHLADTLDAQLRHICTSPIITFQALWYDEQLEKFFFRTLEDKT